MCAQFQGSTVRRNCERCGRPLPLAGDTEPVILVSVFPDQVLNCAVHLSYGPGALPCSTCQHINHTGLPQAIVGEDVNGLIYTPEAIAGGSPLEQRALKAFQNRFGKQPIVVRDGRSFRRAFIETFLLRHFTLLNDFLSSDRNILDWITEHESALDHSFFAAGWLASTGAVFVMTRKAGEAPPNEVLPHEQATESERHVIQINNAQKEVSADVAHVLAALLMCWTLRTMQTRSFDGFRAVAPSSGPENCSGRRDWRIARQTDR